MVILNNFNISVVLLYSLALTNAILFEGQACTHRRSGSPGTCKILEQCPEAVDEMFNKDIPQTPCSWKGKHQVICCRDEKSAQVRIAESEVKIDEREGISRGLCLHYASKVYSMQDNIYDYGTGPTNMSLCGVKYRPLVYGGTLATGKEFPHMALIGYGEKDNKLWNCGGSLITEEWILTAAHCAYSNEHAEPKFVRLGDLDYANNNDDAEPQDFEIVQIKTHNAFDTKSVNNDIALFKLNKKAKITAYVRPACLWTSSEIEAKNNKVIVTGWGDKGFYDERSSHLLQATLSIASYSKCREMYPRHSVIDRMHICAGTPPNESIKDSCQGDSGGPLQIYAKDVTCMYYIIGVTSFGQPCGITRAPGVYTRVSNYIPWIESIIWKPL